MHKPFFIVLFFVGIIFSFTGCGLDCIEKKTGMSKSSETMKQSKKNGLFQFELLPDQSTFYLDSGIVFKINNAWVENSWRYECIDNDAEVIKDSTGYQFVIDASYTGNVIHSHYLLHDIPLGAVLRYGYSAGDTVIVPLYKDKSYIHASGRTTIDVIKFVRSIPSS